MNPERKIVGIGYNGMPNRCSDDELPWTREATDRLETKYPYGRCPLSPFEPLLVHFLYSETALIGHPSTADTHDITNNSESPDCPPVHFNT